VHTGKKRRGRGCSPALPLLHAPPLYDLVVKVQLSCWASELPARSFVSVVSTPLYLVFLASKVVFAPKAFCELAGRCRIADRRPQHYSDSSDLRRCFLLGTQLKCPIDTHRERPSQNVPSTHSGELRTEKGLGPRIQPLREYRFGPIGFQGRKWSKVCRSLRKKASHLCYPPYCCASDPRLEGVPICDDCRWSCCARS
jgi:hypothetical protein